MAELEPVRQALSQGRYDTAFALLERAAQRPRRRRAKALYRLHLAALYALYGDDGLENGSGVLRAAAETDSFVLELPLYWALYWEFGALAGESPSEVEKGLLAVRESGDAEALYHAASALYTAGSLETMLEFAKGVDEASLPGYLLWRKWSLVGLALEELGRLEEAAAAYEKSVGMSTGADEQLERLALAGCQLELRRPNEALSVLSRVDEALLELDDDVLQLQYLFARVHFDLGNPNLALDHLSSACELADKVGGGHFSLALLEGQVLCSLGRFEEAAVILERAVQTSPDEQRTYALHELAVALMDSGEFEAALEKLDAVSADDSYTFRAEALADVSECLFKLGHFDRAQLLAQAALDEGATAAASLTLGSIAQEYYRLDEAATWFERAASATIPGEPTWVLTQQLLADVFAQKGPEASHRLAKHARAALAYVNQGSEWYLPLKEYLEQAERQLGGHHRVVN